MLDGMLVNIFPKLFAMIQVLVDDNNVENRVIHWFLDRLGGNSVLNLPVQERVLRHEFGIQHLPETGKDFIDFDQMMNKHSTYRYGC